MTRPPPNRKKNVFSTAVVAQSHQQKFTGFLFFGRSPLADKNQKNF
jgi:hypothetical protein